MSSHPRALPMLFLTEMWERFGFYTVQGLLVLYMVHKLGFNDSRSYGILGAYTAFVYIMPVIGGYLADNLLGYRRAIIIGGALLCLGYALLSVLSNHFLFFALAVLIVGNGFFKPNISSLLGSLYDRDIAKRDAGFTIFYMGVNLGALLATTSAGFIKNYFGWWACFAMASVGLLLGVIIFIALISKLGDAGKPVKVVPRMIGFLQNKINFWFCIVFVAILFTVILTYQTIADSLLIFTTIVLLLGWLYAMCRLPVSESKRLFVLVLLMLASVVFWAVLFQMEFAANLFINRDIDRHVFGFEIPTIAFMSLEFFFIFVTGPIFAWGWQALQQRQRNPSTPLKFAYGLFALALGFAVLAISTRFHNATGFISPWWIVLAYGLLTIGEMVLSPIGLSMITVLAPVRMVGMMIGVWYIALGFSGKLAGVLANLAAIPKSVHSLAIERADYGYAFLIYAMLAMGVGVILLALVPLLNRLIVGRAPYGHLRCSGGATKIK